MPTAMGKHILLIDSYDSFTFNLSSLIQKVTGANVLTIHNDSVDSKTFVEQLVPMFDAIVLGPGPGTVENPADVGVLNDIWTLHPETKAVPVFGVCLGFQSMVANFGGSIHYLNNVQHGQYGKIEHSESDIFQDTPNPFYAIRYHSMHAQSDSKNVVPLAWTTDEDGTKVLMAGKHAALPYYGVQYHPESVCSEEGERVIGNFWNLALKWWEESERKPIVDEALLAEFEKAYTIKPEPLIRTDDKITGPCSFVTWSVENLSLDKDHLVPMDLTIQLCEDLKSSGTDFLLLNSASLPGRFQIIGLLDANTDCIIYNRSCSTVILNKYGEPTEKGVEYNIPTVDDYWKFIATYMKSRLLQNSPEFDDSELLKCPFVGGLVGIIGYETCLKSLEGLEPSDHADSVLANIQKSIVIDTVDHKIYFFHLSAEKGDSEGQAFLKETSSLVAQSLLSTKSFDSPTKINLPNVSFELPSKEEYIKAIEKAKTFLLSGNSYELCLTGQSSIESPAVANNESWTMYKTLLKRNPSPYSCFLDFDKCGGVTLVGSSPERFMSWNQSGNCEFRPIKGTVKKSEHSREEAVKILRSNKERAENLMIVDLIRHDLNQLLDDVRCDQLMSVEEYKTVYQLVSVISGQLAGGEYSGFDLLAHSLPPGSMTGAPKIRSVELLKELEGFKRRGVYSGVSGYWSVLDEGDWSVVIRSMFKYSGESKWRIGAGGAITILSEDQAEWDEMITKLETALSVFQ